MSSSSSREGSPDWLRSFQAPTTTSLLSLSSPDDSPCRESETISSLHVPDDGDAITIVDKESLGKDSKMKLVTKQVSIEQVFSRRKKKVDASLDLEGIKKHFFPRRAKGETILLGTDADC